MEVTWGKLKGNISDAWKHVECHSCKLKNAHAIRVTITGQLNSEPPRFYMVWKDIICVNSNDLFLSLIHSIFTMLLFSLDSFADNRCMCVPHKDGSIGDHCDFHKGMYGY